MKLKNSQFYLFTEGCFKAFILLLLFVGSGAVKAQNLVAASADQTLSNKILSKFLSETVIEQISYDEGNQKYVRLPDGFDATKLHFLDIPYVKEVIEKSHVEVVLTAEGTCATIISYLTTNIPKNEAVKYRVILPSKILALDENMGVVAETPNSESFSTILAEKGQTALKNGLFQPMPFGDLKLEDVAQLEKQGYKLKIEDNTFRFFKGQDAYDYNSQELFVGEKRYKNDKLIANYSFFKRDEWGNIIPKNSHKLYDDELPTGIKIQRSEFSIISDFKVEGSRYKNLSRPVSNLVAQTKVAPNPINGNILRGETSIVETLGNAPVDYQIVDVNGRVLLQSKNAIANRVFEIDIAPLPNGVYVLRLTRGTTTQSTKFIKQ